MNQTPNPTPIVIPCLDELVHTAENGYRCDDPTCPCWEGQPQGYRCSFCGAYYPLAAYQDALAQPYPKCSHYWSDYEPDVAVVG